MTIHSNDLRAVTLNSLSGQNVTTANSAATGQETINDVLQPGTGGSVQYTLVSGSPYILVTPPTNTSVGRFAYTGLNLPAAASRILWTPLAVPSVTEQIQQIRSASALSCVITATSGATPRFLLLAADGSTTLWTSSVTVTAGQEYRIETNIPQVGATTGSVQVKIYDGPSSTATLLDDSTLLTNKNLGAANIAVTRWGILNRASAQTSSFRFRYPAYNDVAGFIGAVSSAAPTVTVGGDIATEPFTSVPLVATASDPAGGTLTYAWTLRNNTSSTTPTLSSTTSATPTYTSPGDWGVTGSQQTWRCTVTSSVSGLTAFDEVVVAVRPATIGVVVSTGPIVMRAVKARLL